MTAVADAAATGLDEAVALLRATKADEERATYEGRLHLARAIADEAGVPEARAALTGAIGVLGERQENLRRRQMTERSARQHYEETLIATEWELDRCFDVSGNKTLLVRYPDGTEVPFGRPMTADDRKAWKGAEARKLPAVREAEIGLRRAEQDLAEARDELALAERRVQACRHDLDAAVAHLTTLTFALKGGTA